MAKLERLFNAGLSFQSRGSGALGRDLTRLERLMDTSGSAAVRNAQRFDAQGRSMQRLGGRMVAAGTAIFAVQLGAAKSAATLQDRLVILESAFGADERAQMKIVQARREAIRWTQNNVQTAEEYTDATYRMVSAGLDFETSLAGARAGLALATATMGQNADTTELLATLYNNLGDKSKDVTKEFTRISDILAVVQQSFQLKDLNQLNESFKNGTPAALTYGLSLEQTATVLGALNSAGIQGGRAGFALNASMRQLSKASRQLGFEVARTSEGGLDYIETLANIEAKFGDISKLSPEMQEKMQRAFGDEGLRAIALLAGRTDDLRVQLDKVTNSAGATARAQATMQRSLSARLAIMRNNVGAFAKTYGRFFLEPLSKGADLVSAFVRRLTDWAERNPALARGLFIVTSTLATFLVLGGGVVVALGTMLRLWARSSIALRVFALEQGLVNAATASGASTFRLFGAVLKGSLLKGLRAAALGMRALTVSMLTNPVGLIVAGIVAAGALLIRKWSSVKAFFKGLWSGLKPALAPMLPFFTKVAAMAKSVGSAIGRVFSGLFSRGDESAEALGRIATTGEKVGRVFGVVANVFWKVNWPLRLLIKTLGFVPPAIRVMKTFLGGLWEGVRPGLQPLVDFFNAVIVAGREVAGALAPMFGALARWIVFVWTPVINIWKKFFSLIGSGAPESERKLSGVARAGLAIGQGVKAAIKPFSDMFKLVTGIVRLVGELARASKEIFSGKGVLSSLVRSGPQGVAGLAGVVAGRAFGGRRANDREAVQPSGDPRFNPQSTPPVGGPVGVQPGSGGGTRFQLSFSPTINVENGDGSADEDTIRSILSDERSRFAESLATFHADRDQQNL